MSEDNTQKNPLDEMNDESQENGTENQSDAQTGGAAENNSPENQGVQTPPAPQQTTPAAPTPAAPTAPAPQETDQAPAAPQHVAPRVALARDGEDHGITYGKRKAEIAEVLKKQPKVAFMIPRTDGELDGLSYETVQINGHRMEIKKGVMVQIPVQVAEILAEKYRIQMEAGSDKLINRSEDHLDRLS